MDIAFVWNDVQFEARLYVDDYCLWINQLWIVSGEVKVDVTDLLQDMELSDKLNTIAEQIYGDNNAADNCNYEDTLQ